MQRRVPPHLLSRVAAYDWMGSTALRPLGPRRCRADRGRGGRARDDARRVRAHVACSVALLLIPDMWRITDDSPYRAVEPERLGVNPSEG